jgi:molybdenum cofactor biosynthesis enzyme MoaA
MGRSRKFNKVTLTTINISVESSEKLMQLKYRRETQDDLVKRLIAEWEDLKEYRLDMDVVIRLKDRQIESLQKKLSDIKLKQQTTETSVLSI